MKKYFAPAFLIIVLFVQCKKTDTQATGAAANLNNKSVGVSANDILSASKYNAIVMQVQYMPGFAPDAASLNTLTQIFLPTYVNKPGGITYNLTPIAASGKSTLTLNEIVGIETANRTLFTSGNTLAIYVLYVDAGYATANTLGVAYRNTSLVLFGPTIVNNSGGVNQTSRTRLESTVQQHEFGHLMGLVNLGSPMVTAHNDPNNAGHCSNSSCLMYYITNNSSVGGILLNSPTPSLDANCKADLHANGGK